MLNVVFFTTSDPHMLRCLEHVAQAHRVIAVVQPQKPVAGSRARRLATRALRLVGLRPSLLELSARARRIPCWTARSRDDASFAPRLAAAGADIGCLAGYPWILPKQIFEIPRLGSLNMHPSLLPRHRGAMPLQWTYLRNDTHTGATIHRVNSRVDAGDVLSQESLPLERGAGIEHVAEVTADLGARLMIEALNAIERGESSCRVQSDTEASRAPVIRPGTSVVDFAAWDTERVWHVLHGLAARFQEPLADEVGRPVRYDGALGFSLVAHQLSPGAVRTEAGVCRLYCRDGFITLKRRAASP
jgi:methionyl-tRNA formyltransferase